MSVAALSEKGFLLFTDVASSQSIAAIDIDPDVEVERNKLLFLIGKFAREKLIDGESAHCAAAFINLLPADRSFPKIAADGEGALILLWEDAAESLLLAIDGRELLAVQSPATSNSRHIAPAFLRGGDIPNRILSVVPPR